MNFLQDNLKIVAIISVLVITSGVVIVAVVLNSTGGNSTGEITVRLLYNAGVMIEAEGTRIYIDPYDLPSNYTDYPADAILITHNHSDHYDPASIDIIKTDTTAFYFPAIMSSEALLYGANSVIPEDNFTINEFSVRCFYMYTMPGSNQSSHPQSNNYTSYIVEIEGFTIFHTGDSWNIDEYEELTGKIDLVLLPLGPGCQTMTGIDVAMVVDAIGPSYFIPIHFTEDAKEAFIFLYKQNIENSDCEFIDLEYYGSFTFTSSG
ncbi:MAG: MBL fold metallo-hydrolase [Candidatus Odinarchaeota archaeon]